jgi:hypothetical protein
MPRIRADLMLFSGRVRSPGFENDPTEFVIGRSGKWLPLAHFYKLPVEERRNGICFRHRCGGDADAE